MSQRMSGEREVRFTARLWKYPGKGGWTFLTIPGKHAPPITHPWGRTPVTATVDGTTWKTSVWRTREGETLLAVPRNVRGQKAHGDLVRVHLRLPAW
jgi:hypothetical protein